MEHHRKTRTEPNAADPFSEPTIHRRLWAGYLSKGYSRASWAVAMEVSYTAVDQWDLGKVVPRLDKLMRACELLGWSMDELCYGRSAPRSGRTEPELSRDAIKALLAELRVTSEQIEALGEYERSPAGQYQRFTRSYVAAFVERYALARAEGLDQQASIAAAKVTAANARANAEAIALGMAPPASALQLEALGAKLTPKAKPAKRRRA